MQGIHFIVILNYYSHSFKHESAAWHLLLQQKQILESEFIMWLNIIGFVNQLCRPRWLVCTVRVGRVFLPPLHVWECQAEASYHSATGCVNRPNFLHVSTTWSSALPPPFCPLKLLKVDTHGDGLLLLGGTWNRVQQYWAPCESAGSGLLPLGRGGKQVRGLVEVQDAEGDWSSWMVSPCRLHL